jgi:hypothetical protein
MRYLIEASILMRRRMAVFDEGVKVKKTLELTAERGEGYNSRRRQLW